MSAAFILPGTDEEQAIIDERIAEAMVRLGDYLPASHVDGMVDGAIGAAAACYAGMAAVQIEHRLPEPPRCPADWPFAPSAWSAWITADPRESLATATALLWLEMVRLERRDAGMDAQEAKSRPHTCPRCDYDEAEGGLIAQCAACAAADRKGARA